jgi:hypothetical protein
VIAAAIIDLAHRLPDATSKRVSTVETSELAI